MRTDWTISACCHLVVLGAALVSFAPSRPFLPKTESIAVNIVTDTKTSQMTQGTPTAPKETQKPLVEKVEQPNTVENLAAKVAPKEVTASTDATPPPPPPEPPKKEAAKKKAEPTRDLIAEALKKDDAKKSEQKKAADAKVPSPPKRPPMPQTQPQPKFDPREMQALLDKRTPQRKEATGATINDALSLGAKGTAAQLSQSELDALRARLAQLWNPPVGAQNPEEIIVTIRIRLNRDGSLAAPPQITNSGRSMLYMVSRERAATAVLRGAPFTMLRPETYELWKDIEVTFDPRDMIRG